MEISFYDEKVHKQYKEYMMICWPTMVVILCDWGRNELVVLMCTYFGVIALDTHVIIMNLVFLVWGITGGFQQAGCALLGK